MPDICSNLDNIHIATDGSIGNWTIEPLMGLAGRPAEPEVFSQVPSPVPTSVPDTPDRRQTVVAIKLTSKFLIEMKMAYMKMKSGTRSNFEVLMNNNSASIGSFHTELGYNLKTLLTANKFHQAICQAQFHIVQQLDARIKCLVNVLHMVKNISNAEWQWNPEDSSIDQESMIDNMFGELETGESGDDASTQAIRKGIRAQEKKGSWYHYIYTTSRTGYN